MYKKTSKAPSRAVIALVAGLSLINGPARAGEVMVGVATNFTGAAREIGELFEKATGHEVVFSFASTGTLFTQISQGAPFEVFLAADRKRPQKAVDEGLAVAGSRFTYATGKIVLYSAYEGLVEGEATLRDGRFTRIAIANPATAPYGAAAVAALDKLGVYEAVESRLVRGNNIAQTYQFVETGNAEVGFVALSQIARRDGGSRWLIPADLYPIIAQDAVLLEEGAENPAARAFLEFLRGPQAAKVKTSFGYGTGN